MNPMEEKHAQKMRENALMLQTEHQPVETKNTIAPLPDNQSRNSPPPSRITHWSGEDIFDSDYPD